MLLAFLDLIDHMLFQFFITLTDNLLKNTKIERTIKTAPSTPSLPILITHTHQTLHLDIKTLVINKLVHK